MGVVHVVARSVGQHGVDEVRLGFAGLLDAADAAGVPAGRLVLEVPLHSHDG